MAVIILFPSEQQRKKATIAAMVRSVIDNRSPDYLREDVIKMILETYDEYPECQTLVSITPPLNEDLSENQIEAITVGINVAAQDIQQHFSKMFLDILTLKLKLLLVDKQVTA